MKNDKGFTLIEVIISIAALGIICAVLLRLFVVAGDTNRQAGSAQSAQVCVTTAAEALLCADTLYDGLIVLGAQAENKAGRYTYEQSGYDIVIEIEEKQDGYPGTLYSIAIAALENGKAAAQISTAKYDKEQAHD